MVKDYVEPCKKGRKPILTPTEQRTVRGYDPCSPARSHSTECSHAVATHVPHQRTPRPLLPRRQRTSALRELGFNLRVEQAATCRSQAGRQQCWQGTRPTLRMWLNLAYGCACLRSIDRRCSLSSDHTSSCTPPTYCRSFLTIVLAHAHDATKSLTHPRTHALALSLTRSPC